MRREEIHNNSTEMKYNPLQFNDNFGTMCESNSPLKPPNHHQLWSGREEDDFTLNS